MLNEKSQQITRLQHQETEERSNLHTEVTLLFKFNETPYIPPGNCKAAYVPGDLYQLRQFWSSNYFCLHLEMTDLRVRCEGNTMEP